MSSRRAKTPARKQGASLFPNVSNHSEQDSGAMTHNAPAKYKYGKNVAQPQASTQTVTPEVSTSPEPKDSTPLTSTSKLKKSNTGSFSYIKSMDVPPTQESLWNAQALGGETAGKANEPRVLRHRTNRVSYASANFPSLSSAQASPPTPSSSVAQALSPSETPSAQVSPRAQAQVLPTPPMSTDTTPSHAAVSAFVSEESNSPPLNQPDAASTRRSSSHAATAGPSRSRNVLTPVENTGVIMGRFRAQSAQGSNQTTPKRQQIAVPKAPVVHPAPTIIAPSKREEQRGPRARQGEVAPIEQQLQNIAQFVGTIHDYVRPIDHGDQTSDNTPAQAPAYSLQIILMAVIGGGVISAALLFVVLLFVRRADPLNLSAFIPGTGGLDFWPVVAILTSLQYFLSERGVFRERWMAVIFAMYWAVVLAFIRSVSGSRFWTGVGLFGGMDEGYQVLAVFWTLVAVALGVGTRIFV